MNLSKFRRMKAVSKDYINRFVSMPSDSHKSRALKQLDKLEELIIEERNNGSSDLEESDFTHLIMEKIKLESCIHSRFQELSDSKFYENIKDSLYGFFTECKIAEYKMRGIPVNPSEFREQRRKKLKEDSEEHGKGENESLKEKLGLEPPTGEVVS